jgi:Flp pilus assembly protein TadG
MTKNRNRKSESGQAILEFATVVVLMTTLVFGLVDISRGIYDVEVITNLSREGSKLASSGTDVPAAAAAIIGQSDLPNFNLQGEVIITAVTNENGQYVITEQATQGGLGQPSKVGSTVGGNATLPPAAQSIPLNGQSIFVTEVYYSYVPVTPVGALLKLGGGSGILPQYLYDVAYF